MSSSVKREDADGVLDWISSPWKESGIFAPTKTHDCSNEMNRYTRGWNDPLVISHVILFFAAIVLMYKGHYVPGCIILIGMVISSMYHMSSEMCLEDMDMVFAMFISVVSYLTVFTYGGRYVEIVMGVTLISLISWYYAGYFYIGKNDTTGRNKYPGNHPYYCSLHSIWHVVAFGSIACCALTVNNNEHRVPS